MERRIGLIVNPLAGMGGAVGLKGTDGDLATRARALGAKPRAGERCATALSALAPGAAEIDWLTPAGAMGGDCLDAAGFDFRPVYRPPSETTSADDTRRRRRRCSMPAST